MARKKKLRSKTRKSGYSKKIIRKIKKLKPSIFSKGIIYIVLSLFMFYSLGREESNMSMIAGMGTLSWLFKETSSYLLSTLGKAAYGLPLAFIVLGTVNISRFHYIAKSRWSYRSLALVALLSLFFSIYGILFYNNYSLGGSVGKFYYTYITKIFGADYAIFLGSIILTSIVCFLLNLNPINYLKKKNTVLRRFIKNVASTISKCISVLLSLVIRLPILQTNSIGIKRTNAELKNWTPGFSGSIFNSINDFPSNSKTKIEDGDDSEAFYEPLKEHKYKSALPTDILPDTEANLEESILDQELQKYKKIIMREVKTVTGISLIPLPDTGSVGLNSISFEFEKGDGETIPVSRVEKAIKDVGLAVKRSPVMLNIGEKITFELPLKQEERRFAPIKPLLKETEKEDGKRVTYLFGRTQSGNPYELPVQEARHMLVGGSTGGGKTILLHTIIAGIIFRYSTKTVKLALADNKGYEFSKYDGLPHLWHKVATSPEGLSNLIENLSDELQRRKKILKSCELADYPTIITIIDEFYDTGFNMNKLVRLIAEARALNMFFILATQHPLANVISTEIKANLVTSVAFKTKNKSGSRLIIEESDAVNLLQNGDSFVRSPQGLIRIQAGFTTTPDPCERINFEEEPKSDLEAVMKFIRDLENEN